MNLLRACGRYSDILGAAVAAYALGAVLAFFGAAVLGFGLRGIVMPVLSGWVRGLPLNSPMADDVCFRLATAVSWALATLFVAPFVGLLQAVVSRPLGVWRLAAPVVVLVAEASYSLYSAAAVTHPPHSTDVVRLAMGTVSATLHLISIATLMAIAPAVMGAWLGTKLWPKR